MNSAKRAIAISISVPVSLKVFFAFLLFLSLGSMLSASAVILAPTYPDDYSLATEFKLSIKNYSQYETEHDNDVRVVYSLDDISSDDDMLYVVGHGCDDGYLIKVERENTEKDKLTIVPWEDILFAVQENDITTLLIDACKGTVAQEKAQNMTFQNTLTIYAAASHYEDQRVKVWLGHPSLYSYNWLCNKDNNNFKFKPVTILGENQKEEFLAKKRIVNTLSSILLLVGTDA